MATRKITEIKDNATGDINQMRDNDIINNVPSTTSSDAAITTSVPLVAEDGSIVKIKRDSFVEAIASVFAANNQTTFSKLFGVNGTTPMGIEPSALASVLGVLIANYTHGSISSAVSANTDSIKVGTGADSMAIALDHSNGKLFIFTPGPTRYIQTSVL